MDIVIKHIYNNINISDMNLKLNNVFLMSTPKVMVEKEKLPEMV